MRKILCFGDSNTFGYMPGTGGRYAKNVRWTGVLAELLEDDVVVEAGCNNRTAFEQNPLGNEHTGIEALPEYLDDSFDVVVVSVGINDTQKVYHNTLDDVRNGVTRLVRLVKELAPDARVVLVSPSRLSMAVTKHHYFSNLFSEESVEKSKFFGEIYAEVAEVEGCEFVDWDEVVEVSEVDGLHYSVESHNKIAQEMFVTICGN